MSKRNGGAAVIFTGQYDTALGWHGRLVLPSDLRKKLTKRGQGHRLLFSFVDRIRIYAYGECGLPAYETARWNLIGAVKLPREMMELAGLRPGDHLAVLGAKDWIGLWKHEDWEAEKAGNFGFTKAEIERVFQQLDE